MHVVDMSEVRNTSGLFAQNKMAASSVANNQGNVNNIVDIGNNASNISARAVSGASALNAGKNTVTGGVVNAQRGTSMTGADGVTVEFSKQGLDILKASTEEPEKSDLEKRLQAAIEEAKQFASEDDGLTKEEKALKEKQEAEQMLEAMEREMEAAKENAEAMEEGFAELGKILIIARRIMNGDKVPGKDEKKLMEFDGDLYQACKSAAMLKEARERKEYESLWEDEESVQDKARELEDGEVSGGGEVSDIDTTAGEASQSQVTVEVAEAEVVVES